MVECIEMTIRSIANDSFAIHLYLKVVSLRDDLNTIYIVKIRIIWVYGLCFNHLESHEYIRGWILTI